MANTLIVSIYPGAEYATKIHITISTNITTIA